MRYLSTLCLTVFLAVQAGESKDRLRLSLNAESGYSNKNFFADENDTIQGGQNPAKIGLLCLAVPFRSKKNEINSSSGFFQSTYFDQVNTFSTIGFSEIAYDHGFGPKFKAGLSTGGDAFWYKGDYLFGEGYAKLTAKAYASKTAFGVFTVGAGRQIYGDIYSYENSSYVQSKATFYLYLLDRKLNFCPYAEVMLNDAADLQSGSEFSSYSYNKYRLGFRSSYQLPYKVSASGGYTLDNRAYWKPNIFNLGTNLITHKEISWTHNGVMELSWTFLSSLSVTAQYQRTLQTSTMAQYSRYAYKGYSADRFGLRLSYAKFVL